MPTSVRAWCATCGELLPRGSWGRARAFPVRCRKCAVRPRVPVNCEACGVEFLAYQCKLDVGRERFCSKACMESDAFKERTFWSHVDKSGECWTWTGSRNAKGYGHAGRHGRVRAAHRIAWELTHGPIPDGLFVCHTCDNPPCVNPAHLWLGTNDDNMRDMAEKGRAPGRPGEQNPHAVLTVADVFAIRAVKPSRRIRGFRAAIAKQYGVGPSTISKVWAGETWKRAA